MYLCHFVFYSVHMSLIIPANKRQMRTRKILLLMTVNDELLQPIMETIAQRTPSRSLLKALQSFQCMCDRSM